jgi:hypothetical protein
MDKRSGNYIIYKVSVMNKLGRKKKKFQKKMYIKEVLFRESYFVSPIKYFYFYQKLYKKYGDGFDKTVVKLWGLR